MDNPIIIAITGPILITIGGLITWFIKSKREDVMISEEKTREFKVKTYETILEPFMILFTFSLENNQELGISKILSLEYRKAGFDLTTFGSDKVVRSYNQMMQAFFNIKSEEHDEEEYALIILTYVSDLMLNIRKDLYTKATDLERSEMLAFFITDIVNYRDGLNSTIVFDKYNRKLS